MHTYSDRKSKSIIVVGGGSAGWMAANLLQLKLSPLGYTITVVESSQIGIIGVGEGSTPALKVFFDLLSIPESQWMPACQATYKYGIRFNNWLASDDMSGVINHYFHPFPSSLDHITGRDFLRACHEQIAGKSTHAHPNRVFLTEFLAQHRIAPDSLPCEVQASYGYHFDSYLLGEFLKAHGQQQGITVIDTTIDKVEVEHGNQDIKAIVSQSGQRIQGDYFVDCTGFSSKLLQQAQGVKFESFGDALFNDSAVAIPTAALPHAEMATQATAMRNGWAWQIPLSNRTGNGYVYSSRFISSEQAEIELREHLQIAQDKDVPVRHLSMKVGQVTQHWSGNCVAVGLSQGFIEPLEATALYLVQETVINFIGAFTAGQETAIHREQFNRIINDKFNGVKDYIVAHYQCSNRRDTAYWQSIAEHGKSTSRLDTLREVWQANQPLQNALKQMNIDIYYPAISWYCLLSGYQQFATHTTPLQTWPSAITNLNFNAISE